MFRNRDRQHSNPLYYHYANNLIQCYSHSYYCVYITNVNDCCWKWQLSFTKGKFASPPPQLQNHKNNQPTQYHPNNTATHSRTTPTHPTACNVRESNTCQKSLKNRKTTCLWSTASFECSKFPFMRSSPNMIL